MWQKKKKSTCDFLDTFFFFFFLTLANSSARAPVSQAFGKPVDLLAV